MNAGSSTRGGRPTKYHPQFCERALQLRVQGYSKAAIAAELGVVRQTLDNWAQTHPEFLDPITRARGVAGVVGAARFPDDWRDRQLVEVRSAVASFDFNRLTNEEVAGVQAGEHRYQVLGEAVRPLLSPGQ